jgi:hypothetical protein
MEINDQLKDNQKHPAEQEGVVCCVVEGSGLKLLR